MGLKKAESQVKVLLGDTIVALCRNTLNFHAEISVEGLLGITLDNEEIFLVNINQTIKNPDAPANQDKDDGHKRRATSNDRHGKSSSDDSSTDDSDDSTPRRKRRRRNRKKRRSGAPSDGDAVDGSFSKHSAQDNTRRSNESRVTHSDTGQCTQSVPPDVAQSANHSNVTQSVVSHSNVLQSPDLHPNVGQSTSCQSHVSPSASSSQANNSQSGNSTADNDTGQNGVVSVKQEVMSDDENQDEDLIIVKEEIGDAEHPNPVLLFPNVSQTLQQSDPFLTGAPQTSLPQSFMSSTSQSLPSSSPVPGPSNMCPTSDFEQEILLPTFSPPIQDHLVHGNVEPVWNKFIGETAHFYLYHRVNLDNSCQYQKIGQQMYAMYPCIRMESGLYPWSYFTKCLSQKIRHIRHGYKKKNKQAMLEATAATMRLAYAHAAERASVATEDARMYLTELQDEWKKPIESRNTFRIQELLQETRYHREIEAKRGSQTLTDIMEAVPCFQDGYYIIHEFKEKFGAEKWESMRNNMAVLIKTCLKLMATSEVDEEQTDWTQREEMVLRVFEYIEQETKSERTRAGERLFLPAVKVLHDINLEDLDETLQSMTDEPPRLVAFRNKQQLQRYCYIVGDGVVIRCSGDSFLDYMLQLIALYQVFSMEYPKCHHMIMAVFQIFLTQAPCTHQTSAKCKFFCKKLRTEFDKIL